VLEWLETLEEWILVYEEKHIVPAESNARMTEGTVSAALRRLLVVLQTVPRNGLAVLRAESIATGLLKSPKGYYRAVDVFTIMRKLVIRHWLLPRPYFLRRKWSTDHPDPQMLIGKGQKETEEEIDRTERLRRSNCPFRMN